MKTFLALLSFLFISSNLYSQAPPWDWGVKTNPFSNKTGQNCCTDKFGNVFVVTGKYNYWYLDLDGGSHLSKYDKNGQHLWSRSIISGMISDLATDDAGNVYTLNNFTTNMHLAASSTSMHTLWGAGEGDFAVIKYDGQGDVLWTKVFGGVKDDRALSISVSPAGSIYFTGYYNENINFDQLPLSDSTQQCFVTRLNTTGNTLWTSKVHDFYTQGTEIALDQYENVYLLLSYINLDPYPSYKGHLQRFTSAGIPFGATISNYAWDYIYGLAVDVNQNIFISYGEFTTHYPGAWVIKLNSALEMVWGRSMKQQSPAGMVSYGTVINGLSVDSDGNAYVAGTCGSFPELGDTLTWYDYPYPNKKLKLYGSQDAVVFKLKKDSGDIAWAKHAGGKGLDKAFSMCLDKFGNCFVTGCTNFTYDSLTASNETCFFENHTITTQNNTYEAFVAKLKVSDEEYTEPVSIKENSGSFDFRVYPNPSPGQFILTTIPASDVEVCIYDISGACVFTGKNVHEIDLTQQDSGVYFLKAKINGNTFWRKLILN